MNTAGGGASKASEEQQQFLLEVRKLEETARQFQSEVRLKLALIIVIEQIRGSHRHIGGAIKSQKDQLRDQQ